MANGFSSFLALLKYGMHDKTFSLVYIYCAIQLIKQSDYVCDLFQQLHLKLYVLLMAFQLPNFSEFSNN